MHACSLEASVLCVSFRPNKDFFLRFDGVFCEETENMRCIADQVTSLETRWTWQNIKIMS